ncbi:anti-sigma factor family protein [Hyalangium versicolor]|uniref:anti-sigma factor family protein n=1 Tax=Hyalangium versicolor TaxID=2861190 RepID=UPI001CCE579B|nr:zf-HC2 domain-containing protein [Hyalangium versicolor]
MTCTNQEAKAALQALFLGELDAERHARLSEHARTCGECREAYNRLSRVESALEKRALPQGREALLEARLMARVQAAERAAVPRRSVWDWLRVALPAAAVAALAMFVVLPRVRGPAAPEDEWQARKGSTETAFGVRAFCVSSEGNVQAEALPGGKLACPEGASVQFSYTAPEGARLSVAAKSSSGELLQFFPREGEAAPVNAGVDVPLSYSTPVQGGWLAAPLEVRARFTNEKGQTLGETQLTLTPAK